MATPLATPTLWLEHSKIDGTTPVDLSNFLTTTPGSYNLQNQTTCVQFWQLVWLGNFLKSRPLHEHFAIYVLLNGNPFFSIIVQLHSVIYLYFVTANLASFSLIVCCNSSFSWAIPSSFSWIMICSLATLINIQMKDHLRLSPPTIPIKECTSALCARTCEIATLWRER